MTKAFVTRIPERPYDAPVDPAPDRTTLKARAGAAGNAQLAPLQRVLDALPDSLALSYRDLAAKNDLDLSGIDIRVEAGLDLTGPGAGAEVRPGPGSLRIEARLASKADIATIDRLRTAVERHDPVLALLRQATPTRLEISIHLRNNNSLAA